MARITSEDLHSFPFSFYKPEKPLHNYNQVNLLAKRGVHNHGVFRRLCSCFQSVAFGEISAEHLAQIEAANITDPKDIFDVLALDDCWFPLSAKLNDARKITNWSQFCEAKKIPHDDIGSLVFDYALTVWFMLNKFVLDSVPIVEQRRVITIHLVGAETEADILPTFEILLGLLPEKTDLAIHMIGNNISIRLAEAHRKILVHSPEMDSNLLITLNTGLYNRDYYSGDAFKKSFPGGIPFGKAKPTVVMALNANLVGQETWIEAIKIMIEMKQKMLFTEPMEQGVLAVARNLPMLGGRLTLDYIANPFRAPCYIWKKDTNLPGWSNAFIGGMN
jgi:hypothetical protein